MQFFILCNPILLEKKQKQKNNPKSCPPTPVLPSFFVEI